MIREQSEQHPSYTIDLVMLTPQEDQLALLLERANASDQWSLPWVIPIDDVTLDETANQLAQRVTGVTPAWIEQGGAFGYPTKHPSCSDISIVFIALLPLGTTVPKGNNFQWFKLDVLPPLLERHQVMVQHAVSAVRNRMDISPVAFRLLPASFTLSELQQMYELLLGKRLHKASFRRALQAAWLVDSTDEWHSEGRGRPAQLYRYAPKKRRSGRRGVRFDLLAP